MKQKTFRIPANKRITIGLGFEEVVGITASFYHHGLLLIKFIKFYTIALRAVEALAFSTSR